MRNKYTLLYNECVFSLLEREKGPGNALVFARSATACSQKYPVHWGGDSNMTFESMAAQLRAGLSFGLSGFPWWSHDIGGFFGVTEDPPVYKRWVAFGLLSSHSRLHGDSTYRVPWNFDEESVDVLRFFTRLKLSLMPYLYSYVAFASATGLPLMRAMVLAYPDDPACGGIDSQYMLGDELLVAPAFNAQGDVRLYLPGGDWFHLLEKREVRGGAWKSDTVGFMNVPLYLRDCGILPMTDAMDGVLERSVFENLVVGVYAPSRNGNGANSFNLSEGGRSVRVELARNNGTLSLRFDETIEDAKIRLFGDHGYRDAVGAKWLDRNEGTLAIEKTEVRLS
jgi:alpha-D-xyloside xylohydrolase